MMTYLGVSRGAFGGDTPALLGQGLSKRSPLMCAMSSRKRKASIARACRLCHRAEADLDICGRKLEKQGIHVHEFCLLFGSKRFQHRVKRVGLMGFHREDVRYMIFQAGWERCFVCGNRTATITCCEMGCDRRFHLPCAVEGECVTQFLPPYRSFCWEHRPEQAVQAALEKDTTCPICLDPVEDRKSYSTMVCPACKNAWFHRGCIQGQAARADMLSFECPVCRESDVFLSEMLTMGIRVPFSLPSSENSNAYAELDERHSCCDARECLCPGGREHAEEEGCWQLLLCCSCAAEGTHRRCSSLGNGTASWECDSCAGLGTASTAGSELAGPSTASQAGSGSSCSSQAPETSSPCTGSQSGLGQSVGSLASETSSPRTSRGSGLGPSHSSLDLRAAAAPAHLGPTASENAPACNVGPRLHPGHPEGTVRAAAPAPLSPCRCETAPADAAMGPAVRRPRVLALIPPHRHNKVGR
ncbi:PHD finger protein 7-like [Nyctibius grandis]|uniref:PHD finger protein 7-like n=1 Tax=Nyctibius grandis TaxID=48427 RepID=UPI0035BC0811